MCETIISRELGESNTFENLCFIWLQKKKIKLKYSSYHKYDYLIKDYIIPELGKIAIDEVELSIIEQGISNIYHSNRERTVSNSLMKSILYVVNAVLNYGTRLGYFVVGKAIFELPCSYEQNKVAVLESNQETNLISHLINNKTDNNLGILISLFTGMRLGEVCALQYKNIDLNSCILHVRSTVQRLKVSNHDSKTALVVTSPKSKKSSRDIPIPAFLVSYMEEYRLNELDKECYILGRTVIPYEPRTLQYGFENTLRKCGIEHKNYHCLRHTFATNCVKAGFDPKTLSEILGHTSVNFTLNKYVHSDIEQKRLQMEKLTRNYKNAAQIS